MLPEGFQDPGGLFAPDIWLSLERADAFGLTRRPLTQDDRWLTVIARLADGATIPQAEAELAATTAQLPPSHDLQEMRGRKLAFFAMRDGHPEVRGLAQADPMIALRDDN